METSRCFLSFRPALLTEVHRPHFEQQCLIKHRQQHLFYACAEQSTRVSAEMEMTGRAQPSADMPARPRAAAVCTPKDMHTGPSISSWLSGTATADGPSTTHIWVCKILSYFYLKSVSAFQIEICNILNYGKVSHSVKP